MIYGEPVRGTGGSLDLPLASEGKRSRVGPSPSPVRSDAVSRWMVGGHPAGVWGLRGCGGDAPVRHTPELVTLVTITAPVYHLPFPASKGAFPHSYWAAELCPVAAGKAKLLRGKNER